MTTALLVSNVALWIAVVVLAAVVVALVRQIGVLYERVAPAGALMVARGPAVGERAPLVAAAALAGGVHEVGGARTDGKSTLLFFLSPTCPVCKELLPALRAIAREEGARLDLVLASDGPRAEHEAFVRRERLDDLPYLLSAPLGVTYEVGKLPYAVLIDGAGIVRAKGLVNTREHLESLFEAQARGVASIQDFVYGGGAAPRGVEA
jgi:methylamine dehydrogenase accessory protein MauD